MKEKPLVSIIVPVYNVEKYLEKCLDTLIGQTLKNIEIICVNDGSTDNCGEILYKYSQRDSRIIVVKQENHGLSAARNTGMSYVIIGENVKLINAHIDWNHGFLISIGNNVTITNAAILSHDASTNIFTGYSMGITDSISRGYFKRLRSYLFTNWRRIRSCCNDGNCIFACKYPILTSWTHMLK